MGYSNYPDGMRESDIPGWDDVECPLCDGDMEPCECVTDTGGIDPDCEECNGEGELPISCSLCDGTGMASRQEIRDYYY